MTGNPPRPHRFTAAFRLRSKRDFEAVYAGRARVQRGPLVVHALPNELGHSRLGLSIGRRVGGAVRRNRLKRKLREVFRLNRTSLPGDYDVVVGGRAHEDLSLDAYRDHLFAALDHLHATWTKRKQRDQARRSGPDDDPASPPKG